MVSNYHIHPVESGIKLDQLLNYVEGCDQSRDSCMGSPDILRCSTCGKYTLASSMVLVHTHICSVQCSGAPKDQRQRSGNTPHICIQLQKLIIPLNRQSGCMHAKTHARSHTHTPTHICIFMSVGTFIDITHSVASYLTQTLTITAEYLTLTQTKT